MNKYFSLEIPYIEAKKHDYFQHKFNGTNTHRIRFNNSMLNVKIVNNEEDLDIQLMSAIFSNDYEYKKIMGFLYNQIIPLYRE